MRSYRRYLLAILAPVALVSLPAAAIAAPVTNTNDAGAGSLRQAIADANPGDTITVPAGTYTLTSGNLLVDKSLTIAGEGAASTIVRAGATQRVFHTTGASSAITISGLTIRDGLMKAPSGNLEGGGVLNDDASLTLRSVILANNTVDVSGTSGNGGGIAKGGAISNHGALAITDSTLSGNVALARGGSGAGGGISFGGTIHSTGSGTVSLSSTSISGSAADSHGGSGSGGGIAEGGAIYTDSSAAGALTVTGGSIEDSTAGTVGGSGSGGGVAQGGGVYSSGAGATFTGVTFKGDSANANGGTGGASGQGGGVAEGGAIYSSPAGDGVLAIHGGGLRGNSVLTNGGEGSGGGVGEGGAVWSIRSVTIDGADVSGNAVSAKGGAGPSSTGQGGGVGEGGGLYLDGLAGSVISLTASTVSGNTVDTSAGPGADGGVAEGGGVWMGGSGAVDLLVTNITISGNTATTSSNGVVQGGGLDGFTNSSDPLALIVTNVTISANSAMGATSASGGDIYGSGKFRIRNSIVSGGVADNCAGTITSLGHNIDSADTCGFHAAGDHVGTDPQLGQLQDNGGPTPTQAIPNTSPAFDAGDATGCPATDQRGVSRPQNAACDIGAFELELADLALSETVSAPTVPAGATVSFTLTLANAGPSTAHAATVTDALPAATALVSATASAGSCSGTTTVVCALGDVASGASASVNISVRGLKPGPVTNAATAASSTFDPNTANNAASAQLTVAPLAITQARLSPARFRIGSLLAKLSRKVKTGTTVSFRLPATANVGFAFARKTTGHKVGKRCRKTSLANRRKARCTRYAAAGKLAFAGHAGTNKVRFQGRMARRKTLRPGVYRLTITAKDAFGNAAAPVRLRFTLLSRLKKAKLH